jgi:hypothetical protein
MKRIVDIKTVDWGGLIPIGTILALILISLA